MFEAKATFFATIDDKNVTFFPTSTRQVDIFVALDFLQPGSGGGMFADWCCDPQFDSRWIPNVFSASVSETPAIDVGLFLRLSFLYSFLTVL